MPFYFCKGCAYRQPQARETELFITFAAHLCSRGSRGAVSNLATFTVLLPSLRSGHRKKKRKKKRKSYRIWKKWKRRLIPRCSVMQAGDPNGGTRQQYGQQLAQDTVLTALPLAYHNRFPNSGGGWEDGEREQQGRGRSSCIVYVSLWLLNEPFYRLWHKQTSTEEHTNTHKHTHTSWAVTGMTISCDKRRWWPASKAKSASGCTFNWHPFSLCADLRWASKLGNTYS